MEVLDRFVFSGHVIGASAHFHKLDEMRNLDHRIPALGAVVVPVVGGLSHHHVANYRYDVDQPRQRNLLSAEHAESFARGTDYGDRFETEIETEVRNLTVLEKLHVDLVALKQSAVSTRSDDGRPSICTSVANIQGLRLGNVRVNLELDNEPFETCKNKQELLDFVSRQGDGYRREQGWRYSEERNGYVFATVVKSIRLDGPREELAPMSVHDNVITWEGFGKIFLGEVIIRNEDRRVTMIRLKMGSDGGGSGTGGCGHTNGGTGG